MSHLGVVVVSCGVRARREQLRGGAAGVFGSCFGASCSCVGWMGGQPVGGGLEPRGVEVICRGDLLGRGAFWPQEPRSGVPVHVTITADSGGKRNTSITCGLRCLVGGETSEGAGADWRSSGRRFCGRRHHTCQDKRGCQSQRVFPRKCIPSPLP